MAKAFLKSVLSVSTVRKLLSFREKLDNVLVKLCVKYRFTSSLYYTLFNGRFHREHQAVLAGRLLYKNSLNRAERSSVLLRRNTHRLEKGLIMEPRKSIFAADYIKETVETYRQCSLNDEFEQAELQWANQVLEQYFSCVSQTEEIVEAKLIFEQSRHPINEKNAKPYLSEARATSNISAEHLHLLFKQRRSTRWFEDKNVPESLLKEAVLMASQAPSACNRQPFEFFYTMNSKTASEIAACAMGTQGFSHNIQALVVVIGDLSSYPKEQDRHVIYIDGGLVAMQLMLALETLGLASCPINWPDIEPYERKLAKKLNLEIHLRPIMMMAIGYAKNDGGIPFSQKKNADQLMKEINL